RGAALIYPSRRTILAAAAIGPAALVIALMATAFWTGGLALLALLLALCAADAFAGAAARGVQVSCEGPRSAGIGASFAVTALARLRGRAPGGVQFALGVSGPVAAPFGLRADGEPSKEGPRAAVVLQAERRGTARLECVWVRWTGPLG